jgi:hypothetical protein
MSPRRRLPRLTACTLALALALGLVSNPVCSGQVWRCAGSGSAAEPGEPRGPVVYQEVPCDAGGRMLAPVSPPAEHDLKATRELAKREARLARDLARQRSRLERSSRPAHTSLSGPVRQVSVGKQVPASTRHTTQTRQGKRGRGRQADGENVFRAKVPRQPKTQSQSQAQAGPSPSAAP